MAFRLSSGESSSSSDDEEPHIDDRAAKLRFRVELEFVQLLASPLYLHHLAQHDYLDKPAFLRYLRYLRYWCRPEYARFLEYPDCLFYLVKLSDETFRANLKSVEFRDKVHQDQYKRWADRYNDLHAATSKLPADETPDRRHFLSFDGRPPPPDFYELHPDVDRADVEASWPLVPPLEGRELI